MHDMQEAAVRASEFEAMADAEGWSDARRELGFRRAVFGKNFPNDFLLDHGIEYPFDASSFEGERGEQKQCYMNATWAALNNPDLTYVEGKVWVYGIGIDHAWCIDPSGKVIDPTLVIENDDLSRIGAYLGVPFREAYLRKATIWNKVYGLLDYWSAPKTAPKLYELGLEAGQDWLLAQSAKPPRKPRKKKAAG